MRGSYHEGWNQAESALSAATVPSLTPVWNTQIGRSGFAPNSGSPIVVGKSLYVGGPDVSRRVASTGAVVWHTSGGSPSGKGDVLTTPAYDHGIVVAGMTQTNTHDKVVALNAATGAVIWTRQLSGYAGASPSTANGLVYIGVGENKVMALSLTNGSVKWTWSTTNPDFGLVFSPTTDGKGVYFSTGGGTTVWALNAATGAQRWSRALDSGNGATFDGFTVSLLGGRVYAGNIAGFVYSIDAQTGSILWRADVGGSVARAVIATPQAILTIPADANDVEDQVTALSPADGHMLWNYAVSGEVSPGVTTANGVVYLGWTDPRQTLSQIDALALTSGARLARIPLPAPSGTDPAYEPEPMAISSGRLYVARWHDLISLAPSTTAPRVVPAIVVPAKVTPVLARTHPVL